MGKICWGGCWRPASSGLRGCKGIVVVASHGELCALWHRLNVSEGPVWQALLSASMSSKVYYLSGKHLVFHLLMEPGSAGGDKKENRPISKEA